MIRHSTGELLNTPLLTVLLYEYTVVTVLVDFQVVAAKRGLYAMMLSISLSVSDCFDRLTPL